MRVAVLFTGGKDSSLALYRSLLQGHEVVCLVSMLPMRDDSWMFHYPNMHLMDLYSEATELPLIKHETSGVKEREVEDLQQVLSKLEVDAVVSGAITSRYQKERIDNACRQAGLESLAPLWQENPLNLLQELVEKGFDAVICAVYAHGFGEEWLGRKIDRSTVEALAALNQRYGISVAGEGGEYETMTLDAPFFKKRIMIVEAERCWEKGRGVLVVKQARLMAKTR